MTQANNVAIESSQINSSGVLLTTGGGTGLSTVGTNGQVLTSNGTTLSWVTPTTTSPGGSNTQVQYNSSGSFAGSANLTYNGSLFNSTVPILGGSTGGNAYVLNSSGSNYGFISNNSTGVWSLGYGTTIGTLGTSVLSWNSSGQVGINNTNPGTPLDVNGNIRTTNSGGIPTLYLNNGTTQHAIANNSGALALYNDGTNVINIANNGNMSMVGSSGKILNSSSRPMVNQTGGILAVYQATNATTYSLGAGSNVALTGMSITLTPSSSSSRFLVMFTSAVGYGGGATHAVSVARNGSSLNYTSAGTYNGMIGGVLNGGAFPEGGVMYIDSPATASSITYTIIASNDGTLYVGRRNDTFLATSQQMVVMEIAG